MDELDSRMVSTEARLELKVDSDTLISEINASADVITLNGNRFVVNSDNLKIAEDGTITAVDGIFNGEINAQTGKIGSLSIDESGYLFIENASSEETVMSLSGLEVGEDDSYTMQYILTMTPKYLEFIGRAYEGMGYGRSTFISFDGLSFDDGEFGGEVSKYSRTDCTIAGALQVLSDVEATFNGYKFRHSGDIFHERYTASSDYITFWSSDTYFTTTNVDFYYDNATGRVDIFGIGRIGSSLSSEWGFTLCKVAKAKFQPKRIVAFSVAPAFSSKVVASGVAYPGTNTDNPGELRCFGRTAIGSYNVYFSCSYYVDAGLMS